MKISPQNFALQFCALIFTLPFFAFAQTPTNPPQDLFQRGLQQYGREEYEEALTTFQKALAQAKQNSLAKQITQATKRISDCLYALGQYEAALESYRQTLVLQEKETDKTSEADTWVRIGNSQYALGDLDEAVDNFRQALTLAKQQHIALTSAEALSGIGLVFYAQNDFQPALDHYYQSLNFFASAGEKGGMIQALQNIGNANLRLGNFRLAFDAFQNARFLLQEAHLTDEEHEILLAIGLVHAAQASYPLALAAYQKVVEYFLPKNNLQPVAMALYRIGLVKGAEQNWSEALRFAEQAANAASQIENNETLWRAQFEIGRAQLNLKQPAKTQQAWLQAVATVEKMRTQLRGNDIDSALDRVLPYTALASFLIEQNQTIESFNFAERAKAQFLWSILQGNRTRITKTMTMLEIETEKNLRHEAATIVLRLDRAKRNNSDENLQRRLKEQLQKTRADLVVFINRMYVRHPQLKIYRGEAAPVKVDEIGAFVPDDKRALLEFLVTDSETYLYVFTREAKTNVRASLELNVYKLGLTAAELTDRVLRWRQQIAHPEENFQALARELYDLLLAPAQEQLAGKTALTIVPDGILWALPFAALQPKENEFLLAERTLNFAGSFSALREMNKSARNRKPSAAASLLAIAPTELSHEFLTTLKLNAPQTDETSLQALQNIYGATHSKLFLADTAHATNFQAVASSASVLHIAAPTVINNFRPLYSYNLFAPTDTTKLKTGFFPAWKLTQMNLRADLTVFSESTVFPVDRKQGVGLTGMNWAGFVAGSPAVIVSQWQSSGSWQEFHQRYKATASPSQSLQQTMLKLSQTEVTKHPFYWAGFLAMGASK